MHPAGEPAMRVRQMRQLVRDHRTHLVRRQGGKHRIAKHQCVSPPRYPAVPHLQSRRVMGVSEQNSMHAWGADKRASSCTVACSIELECGVISMPLASTGASHKARSARPAVMATGTPTRIATTATNGRRAARPQIRKAGTDRKIATIK